MLTEDEKSSTLKKIERDETLSISVSEIKPNQFENIQNAFLEMGKDLDSTLTKEELKVLLDKNSDNNEFNRKLLDKMNKVFYKNNENENDNSNNNEINEITIKEFIPKFSSLISEMKKAVVEYEIKYQKETENFNKIKLKCSEHQNDKEEIPSFKIHFLNVEFKELENITEKFFYIKLSLLNNEDDEGYETKKFGGEDNEIDQFFIFHPLSRDDSLVIELFAFDKIESSLPSQLGKIELKFDIFKNQGEYEVQLEIPDINELSKINVVVHSTAQYINSKFDYYQEQLAHSTKLLEKIYQYLEKSKEYFNTLSNLKFMKSNQNSDYNNDLNNNNINLNKHGHNEYATGSEIINSPFSNNNQKYLLGKDSSSNIIFLPNINNVCAISLDKENKILYFSILSSIICSLLFTIIKIDFINIIVALTLFVKTYVLPQLIKYDTLNCILFLIGGSFIYDALWYFLISKTCHGKNDSDCTAQNFSFLLTILNDIIKIVIIGSGIAVHNQNKK